MMTRSHRCEGATHLGFVRHELDPEHDFFVGELPEGSRPDALGFEALWALHPEAYHVVRMFGRLVPTPRWQQAYGVDYRYTGQLNAAIETPPSLRPFLDWGRRAIDDRLDGLLVNWYDAELGHHIGPHHDRAADLVEAAPIVTISLGAERVFRLSHPRAKLARDFPARDGAVFILPYATNRAWKHAVPASKRRAGRRISITLRAFAKGARTGPIPPSIDAREPHASANP